MGNQNSKLKHGTGTKGGKTQLMPSAQKVNGIERGKRLPVASAGATGVKHGKTQLMSSAHKVNRYRARENTTGIRCQVQKRNTTDA